MDYQTTHNEAKAKLAEADSIVVMTDTVDTTSVDSVETIIAETPMHKNARRDSGL